MKKFRILEYIKKYQVLIVVISILAGIFSYNYLQGKQTYTASAVIKYTNDGASQGLAPDGTSIDTSDIYSVQVMTEVFKRMGLSYGSYNLDDFRSRVVVTEVVTEEMQTVQEAKNQTGEVVQEKPTQYTVSFTAKNSDSEAPMEFARQVLDNILDVYLSAYGEAHVANSVAYNSISTLDQSNFDYLEIIETIEKAIQDSTSKIETRMTSDPDFRSAINGYSFQDLYQKFYLLDKVKVSNIYAYILSNQVTKDRDVLLAKYKSRIESNELYNGASQSDIDGIKEIIASYVGLMRESGNTDVTYDYILDETNNSAYEDANQQIQNYDQTVEYDKLLESYIDNRTDYEQRLIDAAYFQYVIDVYSGLTSPDIGMDIDTEKQEKDYIGTENPAGENADAADGADKEKEEAEAAADEEGQAADGEGESATPEKLRTLTPAGMEAAAENTQAMLDELVDAMNILYKELDVTSQEFYDYSGSNNVRVMTNIIVAANIQVLFYAGIVVLLLVVICCIGAVVIGRLGDIVEYYVLRDSATGLPNRAGCDRYLASYADKLLPDHFACICLRLDGIKEKNSQYGREACDKMISKFAGILKSVFGQAEGCFIGVNGIGQFLIFSEGMSYEHMETYMKALKSAVVDANKGEACKIEYQIGASESKHSDTYRIKLLMMHAMHEFHAGVKAEERDTEA